MSDKEILLNLAKEISQELAPYCGTEIANRIHSCIEHSLMEMRKQERQLELDRTLVRVCHQHQKLQQAFHGLGFNDKHVEEIFFSENKD